VSVHFSPCSKRLHIQLHPVHTWTNTIQITYNIPGFGYVPFFTRVLLYKVANVAAYPDCLTNLLFPIKEAQRQGAPDAIAHYYISVLWKPYSYFLSCKEPKIMNDGYISKQQPYVLRACREPKVIPKRATRRSYYSSCQYQILMGSHADTMYGRTIWHSILVRA
jgi:hypothetical protein